MLHSSENVFGKHTKQKTINDGLGGPMGSRYEAVKQSNKSKNKQNKELKALDKQNKMLFRISKKSGLRRKLNNIQNIRAKASKKRYKSSSNSSSDE